MLDRVLIHWLLSAERRGLAPATPTTSNDLFYLGGLTEASTTLICLVLMCL